MPETQPPRFSGITIPPATEAIRHYVFFSVADNGPHHPNHPGQVNPLPCDFLITDLRTFRHLSGEDCRGYVSLWIDGNCYMQPTPIGFFVGEWQSFKPFELLTLPDANLHLQIDYFAGSPVELVLRGALLRRRPTF